MCLLALAFIFVPSMATCPSFTSPALSHSRSACTNSFPSASRCTSRKSFTVVKCGCSPPAITRNATSSYVARASRREENTPTLYPYTNSATIIAGGYGRSPRPSFSWMASSISDRSSACATSRTK